MGAIFPRRNGKSVIVALDHGGIAGPLHGIEKPRPWSARLRRRGADAMLTTRGFVRAAAGSGTAPCP